MSDASAAVFSADWVLPVAGPPIEDGAIAVADGRIAAVGPAAELGEGRRFTDAAIVPGLVNVHAHLDSPAYAGFGDGLAFGDWLRLLVERRQALDDADHRALARVGAHLCLAAGTTTVCDVSATAAGAFACAEAGLRATAYVELFHDDPDEARERFARSTHDFEPTAEVRLGAAPHSPYTAAPAVWEVAYELALPVTAHVAESPDEVEFAASGTGSLAGVAAFCGVRSPGTTPVRALAAAGLLRPGLLAAHCVQLDDEEIGLLAGSGIAVAHCPRANAGLGCGIAPLRELLDAGVAVGLGTDGLASAHSLDPWDDARAALAFARARARDPGALSGADALRLATAGGARAAGLAGTGTLEPAAHADFAVVSLTGMLPLTRASVADAVVAVGGRERILATYVGGVLRYERGDELGPDLLHAVEDARRRMLTGADTEFFSRGRAGAAQ
ncbi:MAG TPA: amidohydrolase family protein [Gaiellaceae bacterium]|nr:amidohydrolase family protein [Gaiellaceae bacterium]